MSAGCFFEIFARIWGGTSLSLTLRIVVPSIKLVNDLYKMFACFYDFVTEELHFMWNMWTNFLPSSL